MGRDVGFGAQGVESGEEFGGAGEDVVEDLFFLEGFGDGDSGCAGDGVTGVSATLMDERIRMVGKLHDGMFIP